MGSVRARLNIRGAAVMHSIIAQEVGHFAVHPDIVLEVNMIAFSRDGWTVTHRGAGLVMGQHIATKEAALDICAVLNDFPVDWTFHDPMRMKALVDGDDWSQIAAIIEGRGGKMA